MTEPNDDQPCTHRHFYLVPDLLPQPDDTDTEWIQRVAMLGDVFEEVASNIFHIIQANAPVLLGSDSLLTHLIGGLGVMSRGIHATGTRQLAKRGLQPLSAEEEQVRVVRDQLADPRCSGELRDALLAILQHNLERTSRPAQKPAEPVDFPEEGFVIGGDGEV